MNVLMLFFYLKKFSAHFEWFQ